MTELPLLRSCAHKPDKKENMIQLVDHKSRND